ncbi:MAG: hypothetical protein CMM15_15130 [Rhodospirillaceae bacterium]|nr:hypothetical protein [Rhodospirillaceae bacterium]|tara:strand:+ start:218 stop:523 length:306 start_codon:yes stop_codon:yes gene_type:complete
MLILDGEWLKKNLSPTFHISNLQGYRLWIQWPYSRDGLLAVADATASVHNAYGKNLNAIHDAAVTIVVYDTGDKKSRVSKTAFANNQNQFWTHAFGKQFRN